jgi:hypothetical protein
MKASLLREAIRVAHEKHGSHPMRSRGYCLFSFIVERNKLLGVGFNNRDASIPIYYGYSKRQRGWDKDFQVAEHAEISAWRKCRGLIENKFELINVRLTDGKKVALSAPCECCQEWLRENGCIAVHFTTGSAWAKIRLT